MFSKEGFRAGTGGPFAAASVRPAEGAAGEETAASAAPPPQVLPPAPPPRSSRLRRRCRLPSGRGRAGDLPAGSGSGPPAGHLPTPTALERPERRPAACFSRVRAGKLVACLKRGERAG